MVRHIQWEAGSKESGNDVRSGWRYSPELISRVVLKFLVQIAGSSETFLLFSSVMHGAAQGSCAAWKCQKSKFRFAEMLRFLEKAGEVL